MLSETEFKVLVAILHGGIGSQREIASKKQISLGATNQTCRRLMAKGLINGYQLTAEGYRALAPYKVENAVIMAAGMSTRFAPLSYEKPKGVLRVRGEVLIERQIKQLQEAGIRNITLVVGYMKESFFYLEDAFGVEIRVNEEYATRNNNSTLMLVKEKLGNTYICSSDDYFVENPFEPYVYKAYYATQFFAGKTDEYCVRCGSGERIIGVEVGGCDAYGMLGHVYFDRAFSKRFVEILEAEYERPETAPLLWEDIYSAHVKEFDMVMRPYAKGQIFEFDSLNDMRDFDQDFIANVDSSILDNICRTLECDRREIIDIVPIKQGLTNLSFRFVCRDAMYVYRHPGAGTDEIINRTSEVYSQNIARDLGIDETFIYEDPQEGWKISRYIENCEEFDYHNVSHVRSALGLGRNLHESGISSQWSFDVHEKACSIVGLLKARSYPLQTDFDSVADLVSRLADYVRMDNVKPCLCHNDFYAPNFLIHGDKMHLIDWEYSAMSDYASDLGTFICCSGYGIDEATQVVEWYFERKPTDSEMRHCMAYVAISAYYWFVWALYKEAEGDPVGEWLYLWYRATKLFGEYALGLYER